MTGANSVFQSDHVFTLIAEFATSPILIFYYTLAPLLTLTAWSLINKTLVIIPSEANKEGHGLFSRLNAYLLVCPFLNAALLSCYHAYSESVRLLVEGGVISSTAVAVFRDSFAGLMPKVSNAFSYAVGIVIGLISLNWKRWKKERVTDWNKIEGKPRAISYFFHLYFFGLQLPVLFNWMFNHLLFWHRLDDILGTSPTYPYHVDRMFGFGFLGDAVWYTFVVVFLAFLLVLLWVSGGGIKSNKFASQNHGQVAAISALLIFAPAALLLPLSSTHEIMAASQRNALAGLSILSVRASEDLDRNLRGGKWTAASESIGGLRTQSELFDHIRDNSTWPIPRSIFGFAIIVASLLSPFLAGSLIEVVRRRLEQTKAT